MNLQFTDQILEENKYVRLINFSAVQFKKITIYKYMYNSKLGV